MKSDFVSSLRDFVNGAFFPVYTAIPCRIIRVVDAKAGIVDVQPLINLTDDTDQSYVRPTILSVPLQTPASGASVVHIPVKEEDIVLCVFSMRGLDAFKSGDGTPAAPTDFRMFDKRDAIAIPGIFPFEMHPNLKRVLPFNPDALSLSSNIGTPLENTVELSEVGVKTQMGAAILNVTHIGIDITGVLTINGMPYIGHTHSGVTTGTGFSGPVSI